MLFSTQEKKISFFKLRVKVKPERGDRMLLWAFVVGEENIMRNKQLYIILLHNNEYNCYYNYNYNYNTHA